MARNAKSKPPTDDPKDKEDAAKALPPDEINTDLLWGGSAIAAYLRVPTGKFYYLNSRGAFGDAVVKHGHRTFSASKRALDQRVAPASS
jgi:hypothetical protein